MGSFWYVMTVMFKERLFFLEEVYVLLQFAVSWWLCELLVNVSHMIRCLEHYQGRSNKVQRRRERLLMHGYLLITMVRMIMN
jgi:hypothetical protein